MESMTGLAADTRGVGAANEFRRQLGNLVDELTTGRPTTADVARELDDWLRHPDVRRVIECVPGGDDGVLRAALREYSGFIASPASNATDPVGVLRIVLLQQLDLCWWSFVPDLADGKAVAASPELIDLRPLRQGGGVHFGFGIGSDRLLRRGRDYVVQRLRPSREPRGPGLPFLRARPEIISLLNEIADTVAALAPSGTPPVWVNSIVRSVEHQRRLRGLGFTALLPSSHCRGWAADVELAWFDRFGADGALREVLLGYMTSGVLNVIDEGRAWHVCLSPHAVGRYRPSGQLCSPDRAPAGS
jgi:hypothetical protein